VSFNKLRVRATSEGCHQQTAEISDPGDETLTLRRPDRSSHAQAVLQLSTDDLALFSAASRDRNPLHLSEEHGHRSAFGGRVAFGVLGALAGIGLLQPRPERRLRSLVLEFPNPMLPGVEYQTETSEEGLERASLKLLDGKRLLVRATLQRAPDEEAAAPHPWPDEAPSPDEEAADVGLADLQPGLVLEGEYRPDWPALRRLAERWALQQSGFAPELLACLCGCSYLVGMRLPGRQALFSRLALRLDGPVPSGRLSYQLKVVGFDARFDLLSMQVTWRAGGEPLARADLQAFYRREVPSISLEELRLLLPGPPQLLGRSALVVGASRGLGAATAAALALQGASVMATYRQSRAQAEALEAVCAGAPGRLRCRQGDAADLELLGGLRAELERTEGGLDLLVCSACPPLLPLWLEPASAGRIVEHLASAVAMVCAPLSTFLPALQARSGRCVILSSSAVSAPLAEWPHYVGGKCALEGLARVAALEFADVGFLVVRPPRLLTELTNTPLGRQTALPPAAVAAALVQRLLSPAAAGQVEILESFPSC
jgi:NAD(P)-dependent dehydrogenase (short-subunit alcohol dehydrogenase family)/acyl dehydratase